MRRYLAAGLLVALVGQSAGPAFARSPGGATQSGLNVRGFVASVLAAIDGSQIVAQLSGGADR